MVQEYHTKKANKKHEANDDVTDTILNDIRIDMMVQKFLSDIYNTVLDNKDIKNSATEWKERIYMHKGKCKKMNLQDRRERYLYLF